MTRRRKRSFPRRHIVSGSIMSKRKGKRGPRKGKKKGGY
jgi:hypothetical protein